MEFTIIKSRAMTLNRSPQCRAFSRAVMDEKSLSLLFPVGVGAVVTNDYCIISDSTIFYREVNRKERLDLLVRKERK